MASFVAKVSSARRARVYIARDRWEEWCPRFSSWLEGQISPEAIGGFHAAVEPDWLTWLDQRVRNVSEGRLVCQFGALLRECFQGVEVVHATRLEDLSEIQRLGIKAWSAQELRQSAEAAYGGQVPDEALQRAIHLSRPDHRGGKVYCFTTLSHAREKHDGLKSGRVPEFAHSGGEFLRSVGRAIGINGFKNSGHRAYLLLCNLPWTKIPQETLEFLIEDILCTVLTWRFLDASGETYRLEGSLECVHVEGDILPQEIAAFADVEALCDRNDLKLSDIEWQAFPR